MRRRGSARQRSALLTAEMTALYEAREMDESMPTPHTIWPSMAAST